MESTTVIRFEERRGRTQRMSRVRDALRRLGPVSEEEQPRSPGRAWINGVEVGGTDARFGHLGVFHD